MGRMVPMRMLPTESAAEALLYRAFEERLPDEFVCFHGRRFVRPSGRGGIAEREADFIVAHPELGALVIEVKGGEVEYDPGRGVWRQRGLDGEHDLDEDPFRQAQSVSHQLLAVLKERRGWEVWLPSIGSAVAFPDGRYEREANPGAPRRFVIDRDDLHGLDRRVPEIMRAWLRPGRDFGPEGMRQLEQVLGVAVSTHVPLKVLWHEQAKELRRLSLTDEQLWVRDSVLGRTRAGVVGTAGSGKTMLALGVARDLAVAGCRTLLTCFNKALARYLREEVGQEEGIDAAHFHGLCADWAIEAGLPLSETAELQDGSPYFEEHLPDLLAQAAEILGPRYDAIVVDEAQDFKEWWWPALLSTHHDPDQGRLYLFADSSQNLYGGALPLNAADFLPPLRTNLRNTEAISKFVGAFYDGVSKLAPRGPKGTPVEIHGYDGPDDLAGQLAAALDSLVTHEGFRTKDIVLLTPSRRAKSELRKRGGVDGFPFLDLEDLLEEKARARSERRPILVSTIHRFKGLESPVVVLAEMGERHADELDKYLYVGASRASSALLVFARRPVDEQIRKRAGT